ncbi:hypothetical protein ACFQJ5_08060 [Halomicroarcula sp. GCM10025324]|uniref:DUF7312 domain-containing protein n=1 Tax=Haloarcula TaxID=2237 RepID=UPI0023E77D79|nr:hypothetical protein [Halomicroarcula sp. ZS-22-S1]
MADDGGWRQPDEDHDGGQREDQRSAREPEAADGGNEHAVGALDADDLADGIPEEMIQEAADDEDGAVAGSFAPDLDVTPGTPRLENVVFVALGVYAAALAVGRMFVGASMYTPETLGALTVGVVAGTALLYGFFVGSNPDT